MATGGPVTSLTVYSSELAHGTDGEAAAGAGAASVIATESDAAFAMVAVFAMAAGSVEIGAALGTEVASLTALLAGIAVASHTGAGTSMAADSMAEVVVASTVAVAGFMAEVAVASTEVADRAAVAADTVAAIAN